MYNDITEEEWKDWFSMPQGEAFIKILIKDTKDRTVSLRRLDDFDSYLRNDSIITGIEVVLDHILVLKGGG